MSKFYNIGKYEQKEYDSGEITCSCMWGTFQIEKFVKDWQKRKDCKHIKLIKKLKEMKGG